MKFTPKLKLSIRKPKMRTVLFFLLPFLFFYCLEGYTHNPWQMELLPQLINYLLFLLVEVFLYAVTGHSWCGTLFLSLYTLVVGIANYFVMEFRGNPILPWDLRSLNTALEVSDNYSYDVDLRFILCTIIIILALICGIHFRIHTEIPLISRARLGGLAASCCLFLLIFMGMMNDTVTSVVLTPTNLFSQWASYRDNGFTVSFIQNLQYLRIDQPDQYDASTLDEELADFLARYEEESSDSNSSDAENEESSDSSEDSSCDVQPQVIVIMNESFSDLSVLHEFKTNEDYMPFIHSLQSQNSSNVITGNLFVSVCGGNTANTEFEFLTGNTMAFLPSGSVPYQQYISEELDSLASQFSSAGYESVALHPYGASGWNRDKVYPLLGFSSCYFRSSFTSAHIIRKYVSDESAYSKIMSLYETRDSDENLFLFEVTMQNHGGYSEVYDSFPIQVELSDISTKTSYMTENYLPQVQESDRAFEELISTLEETSDPVIVVMFGDHQPNDLVAENIASLTGNEKGDRSLEELQNRYVVPYVIWANFDLDKEAAGFVDLASDSGSDSASYVASSNVAFSENALSANYLGDCIAKLAGLETSLYQDFLLILRETLPVINSNGVIDAEGNYMTLDEAREAYPELINLYEKLQYRMLFDS